MKYTPMVDRDMAFATVEVPTGSPITPRHSAQPHHRVKCRMPSDRAPCTPPTELHLDMFFFRRIFLQLEKSGYTDEEGRVHFSVLRNVSVRLLDAMGRDGLTAGENGFFMVGSATHKAWFTWKDVCRDLKEYGHPTVRWNLAERIFLTLERPDTSRVASYYSLFMLLVILFNLALIVIQSLSQETCRAFFPWNNDDLLRKGQECGDGVQAVCIILFSAEYLCKLMCCPFVSYELIFQEILLDQAVPAKDPKEFAEHEPMSPVGRIARFFFSPANLIDLVSILPWWLKELAGGMLGGATASFLRVIRVARILRILKTGRYVQTLQVLGVVLANSGRSMIILMLFILVVAFVSGVLLKTSEAESEEFMTIPQATYWAFAQLIGMKHAPLTDMKVQTTAGVLILSLVMTLKGILWILPIGQIKSAFDAADLEAKKTEAMRDSMEYELTRPSWSTWYGLASSARVHLFIADVTSGSPPARASFPAPLLECRRIRDKLVVPIKTGIQPWWSELIFGHAELNVEIDWVPDEEMVQEPAPTLPKGQLTVRVLNGFRFPGTEASRWRVVLCVPTGLFGGDSVRSYETMSASGGSNPQFVNAAATFEVHWKHGSGSPSATRSTTCSVLPSFFGGSTLTTPTASPAHATNEEAEFRRTALALLKAQSEQLAEQSRRLTALEQQLAVGRR